MTVSLWTLIAAILTLIAWALERAERKNVQAKATRLAEESAKAQQENTLALQNLEKVLRKRLEVFGALNEIIEEKTELENGHRRKSGKRVK